MRDYREVLLIARLEAMSPVARSVFAGLCAERLWPLYLRFARATHAAGEEQLAAAFQHGWDAVQGLQVDLASEREFTQASVPSDETDWTLESGYGQSAIACLAYFLRTCTTGDVQEAVWSARQVYEAADYAAQHSLADLDLNSLESEQVLLAHPLVQAALAGIEADLAGAARVTSTDWTGLREQVRREAMDWAAQMP
ncbi:DUF416 family protein [Kribbella sp. NPDC055071]